MTFLNDVFRDVFALTDGAIVFDSVVGNRTGLRSNNFQILEFQVSPRFNGEQSVVLPVTTDLDSLLVDVAFQSPINETLLILLRNLPPGNPYSNTTRIVYENDSNSAASSDDDDDGGMGAGGIATIAGAFALAFVLTGAAAARRIGVWSPHRRRDHRNNKSYSVAEHTESTADEEPCSAVLESTCSSSVETASLMLGQTASSPQATPSSCGQSNATDEDEEIDFEYPTKIRDGASYVEPKGLFEAPFVQRDGLRHHDSV